MAGKNLIQRNERWNRPKSIDKRAEILFINNRVRCLTYRIVAGFIPAFTFQRKHALSVISIFLVQFLAGYNVTGLKSADIFSEVFGIIMFQCMGEVRHLVKLSGRLLIIARNARSFINGLRDFPHRISTKEFPCRFSSISWVFRAFFRDICHLRV